MAKAELSGHAKTWEIRGRSDALRGSRYWAFDEFPAAWTAEEKDEARKAYRRGWNTATMQDRQLYRAIQFKIGEAENLVASATIPTRARDIVRGLREDLAAFEKWGEK